MTKTSTKKTTSKKKRSSTKKKAGGGSRTKTPSTAGKQLVIVESPAKAKTINKYLGGDFVVTASVGHIRDLPAKSPKGVKQPVPGVDLENDFEPTYEVLPGKKKVVTDLKKAAKDAADVWFATDLDREGEAIAWHLTQLLDIDAAKAKRVVFNAITKAEIQNAFANPHSINEDMVNAQQARRILDRIVGYQVSPLLWKKVARGLSAGRVQSVAVRLVVEREREIMAFVPDEYWKASARLAVNPADAAGLIEPWQTFVNQKDEKGKGPTIKARNAWLAENNAIKAELVEIGGKKFDLGCKSDDVQDLSERAQEIAEAIGLQDVQVTSTENESGKGPARWTREISGEVDTNTRYAVKSVETKRTTSRPTAPFITSTLQMAASSALGFGAKRTMRAAQSLYEGVNVPGEGLVGLITYMRTDSTHLSKEAVANVRDYIGKNFSNDYLPEKPNRYGSSNKAAQEAHEAIRPTDAMRHPNDLAKSLKEDEAKLYRLIWNRFVACQMTPAKWDSTTVLMERSDQPTGAVLKTTGRVLVFDGFYRVSGVPTSSDEQTLPDLKEQHELAPFALDTTQHFTSPPPRYSEASLVKTLEAEGIGRPSTYASIIGVIQDRNYVEQIDRRFYATDLGMVVTDKLIEAFPRLMDLGYTKVMEEHLDEIAEQHADWVGMLRDFYARFSEQLENAHETMTHAKAETEPAPYACPECGSQTCYRFGKNGRFLSCTAYPDCDYAAPIDRDGVPMLPEMVDMVSPVDGSDMILRNGRFGKFLASVNYPENKMVVNLDKKGNVKYPAIPPYLTDLECEKCGEKINLRRGKRGPWLGCSAFPKCRGRMGWKTIPDETRESLENALEAHEAENPQIILHRRDGSVIPDGTPIETLLIPGGKAELDIHPDAPTTKSEAA